MDVFYVRVKTKREEDAATEKTGCTCEIYDMKRVMVCTNENVSVKDGRRVAAWATARERAKG